MFAFLRKLWICYIWRYHDWTCKAYQGVPPSDWEIPRKGDSTELILKKFNSYATMFCARCGHISEKSKGTE